MAESIFNGSGEISGSESTVGRITDFGGSDINITPIFTPDLPPLTLDTQAPIVTVFTPNGGELYTVGQQVTIQWASSDNVGLAGHDIKFSATGAAPFEDVISNLPGSARSFTWTVPNRPTSQGVIRVVARDFAGNQGADRSDGTFTILGDTIAPTIRVLTPNGGEIYQPGQQVTIQWTSSDNRALAAHDVKFSADGGVTFEDVINNLPGGSQSFSWTVPNRLTTQGVIRVVARDTAGNQMGDRGDGFFTIRQNDVVPPTITVLTPNGGETFQPGQQVTIQWTSTDNVALAGHDIKFSATGDAPFEDVVNNLSGATRSFVWTVPNRPTTLGVIRVTARDTSGNQTGDRSDGVFTIWQNDTVAPSVTVTVPAGGEIYVPGQQVTIQWNSSDNVGVVAHDIKFSATGDAPFEDIVNNLPGTARSFVWTVPNRMTSLGAIRVVARDAAGNQGGGRSNLFTIRTDVNAPLVTVTSPNGGETFQVGQPVNIQWNSSDDMGIVAHDVLFSTTGVAPFEPVISNLPGTARSFMWTVPNRPTTQGAIRVTARDAAGNQGADRSDGVFTITAVTPLMVSVITPGGGEVFTPGQLFNIRWITMGGAVAHDVKFSADGGLTFQDIVNNLSGTTQNFLWAVPNQLTTQGVIRVIARNSAGVQASDLSDGRFSIVPGDMLAPTVTVVTPNGGESYMPGQQVTIQWNSSDNVGIVAHDVKFSATGDAPFEDIAVNLAGTARSFAWTVPNRLTSLGVIRVTARDAAGNQGADRSDGVFTIRPVDAGFTFLPTSGPDGIDVEITGAGLTGVTGVEFNGIPSPDFSIDPSGVITAEVPEGATNGPITLRTASGAISSSAPFTVTIAARRPRIDNDNVTPKCGPVGTIVTIPGMNFTEGGASILRAVKFNGVKVPPSQVVVESDTLLRAPVPAGATSGPIIVKTTNGKATSTFRFLVAPVPTITSIPSSGPAGGTIMIRGRGLVDVDGSLLINRVLFDATAVTPRLPAENPNRDTILVDIPRTVLPAGATSVTVQLTLQACAGSAVTSFTVTQAMNPPIINTITPTVGPVGTRVFIFGDNFADAMGTNLVTAVEFNGRPASFTVLLRQVLTAIVPAGATSGDIVVRSAGGSSSRLFTVTAAGAPAIDRFVAPELAEGNPVEIQGRNLTGATDVRFGGVAAPFLVNSERSITAFIPSGAGSSVQLTVTTPNGTVAVPRPFPASTAVGQVVVTGFEPMVGKPGTEVAIFGSGLDSAGQVTFTAEGGIGTVSAQFVTRSRNMIVATVPPGAGNGPIAVNGVDNNGTFIARAENNQPALVRFDPTVGTLGSGVTLFGVNFTLGAGGVRFGGVPAGGSPISDNQIPTAIPFNNSLPLIAKITLQARMGRDVNSGRDVVIDNGENFLTVSGFMPESGAVGTMVTITGGDFTGATAVTFNGVGASFTVDEPAKITARVPQGATSGPIGVTTPSGTITTRDSFTVTTSVLPTITGFSPGSGAVNSPVSIAGANLGTATEVTFNGVRAVFSVEAGGSLRAIVPPGATSGPIRVTTPAGSAVSSGSFTVTVGVGMPSIAGFSPSTGGMRSKVLISGTNFTGATVVRFGAAIAPFFVSNPGLITTIVPPGAITGPISVTTPAGTAVSRAIFTVIGSF